MNSRIGRRLKTLIVVISELVQKDSFSCFFIGEEALVCGGTARYVEWVIATMEH